MTIHPTPRPAVSNGASPPVARPAAAYPVHSGQGVAAGKGLTFWSAGGTVLWSAGGPAITVTQEMADDLTAMLTQEGIDGAAANDIGHVRSATRMLHQLADALRAARMWHEAANVISQPANGAS